MMLSWRPAPGSDYAAYPAARWWQRLYGDRDEACVLSFAAEAASSRALLAAGAASPALQALRGSGVLAELVARLGPDLAVPVLDDGAVIGPGEWPSFAVDADGLPTLPPTGALIAVVDDAIAFANRRFRRADGGTRFAYLWHQDATVADAPTVPLGREFVGRDLDAALAAAPSDAAAYRSLDMLASTRPRLARVATHGTHVADLAGGAAPGGRIGPRGADDVALLGVNLPVAVVHDASGVFFEVSATLALMRIFDHAAALDAKAGATLPMVVNLSFGLTSGAPDGSGLLPRVIDALVAARPGMQVVLPAGNQLQARLLGRIAHMAADRTVRPGLRVLPDDATSSIVEITAEDGLRHARLDLIPPAPFRRDAAPDTIPPDGGLELAPDPGAPPMAALYRAGRGAETKVFLMLAPSRGDLGAWATPCQPGPWTLSVTAKAEVRDLRLQIRRGDTPGGRRRRGRAARLVDPSYPVRDAMGDWIVTPPLDGEIVRRQGTLSTLAGTASADIAGARTGGARPVPAAYSAVPRDGAPAADRMVHLIADDSPVLLGRRAAGVVSGSAVRYGGTSVASALYARHLAERL